jgi:putative hemolysin
MLGGATRPESQRSSLSIWRAGRVSSAQRLRYRVFAEGWEHACRCGSRYRRDMFDPWCDHLLVTEEMQVKSSGPTVFSRNAKNMRVYSEQEFDLTPQPFARPCGRGRPLLCIRTTEVA